MKKFTFFIAVVLLVFISADSAFCQCIETLPINTDIVTGNISIVNDSNYWYVGNRDSITNIVANGGHFYLDNGSYGKCCGSGSGNTIYVKGGAVFEIANGSSRGNTIYFDTLTNIRDSGYNLIVCPNMTFVSGTTSILGAPTDSTGSFDVYISQLCDGPQITVVVPAYSSTYNITTYYGDGTNSSSSLLQGFGGGYAILNHTYQSSGTYSVKQVLYDGTTPLDSLTFSYNYTFCSTLPVSFYYDANGNCTYDNTEHLNAQPIAVEVDSDGVAIDTLSCTGGLYYNATGMIGDIYAFKVLPTTSGLYVTCPASGIIYDTLVTGVNNLYGKFAGLQCATGNSFDLSVLDVIPVTGVHDEWGNVYVSNNSCISTNATVTLHYSTDYNVIGSGGYLDVSPSPTSYSDSTITWNLTNLSSTSGTVDLYYAIWTDSAGGLLTPGDTVHTFVVVTPVTGDADTVNNFTVITDTVKAGCDPNEMSVSPAGCIGSGAISKQLQYTINFTNTGNDTAFNIYAMDTLSANVDLKSLRIVSASATMNTEILNTGGYNIVKFDFPHINLLDSIQHPAQCSGGVIFNINTKTGLSDGATIANHAGIFFDINPVVMTNAVENEIGCTNLGVTAIQANTITIYPNPTTTALTVTNTQPITNITITNLVGQMLSTHNYNTEQVQVNVADLPAGVYFIKINSTEVRKFVKE